MSGDFRGTLRTLRVTFCIVIIRCTATFWSSCIKHLELSYGHNPNKLGNVRERTIEALSWNHGRSGTAIIITYSECGCSLWYTACDAHPPYCCLWPAPLYNIFQHCLIKCMILEGKNVIGHKMRVLISSTNFVRNISHSKKIWAYIRSKIYTGLNVKCHLFLSDFN
jgi:hypothetical protein